MFSQGRDDRPNLRDTVNPGLVPFNRPLAAERQLEYVGEVISGGRLAGNGQFCERVEERLESLTTCPSVLLTTSCTHALEMTALLLDADSNSEVIVPDFTFSSTANAFAQMGLRPVFADIDPHTFNISPQAVRTLITERTVAVVAMHYGGVACDMEDLQALCNDHQLVLIEDNAHGFGGTWNGRQLGTFGQMATQSFHETKNVSCGQGGALLLNHLGYEQRAEILREKGTDRTRFQRGQIDKYTWKDAGSNYVLSEVQAAMLFAQLEALEVIKKNRSRACIRYSDELADWASEQGVRFQRIPEEATPPHHLFALLMPDSSGQADLIEHLQGLGVTAVFHYQPLHESDMGQHLGATRGSCPVSIDTSRRLVRLPVFSDMRPDEVDRVVEAVISYRP